MRWSRGCGGLPVPGGAEPVPAEAVAGAVRHLGLGGAPGWAKPRFEPGLPGALAALSQRQRLAVVLVPGFGYTLRELAELTGIKVTTVQNHLERAWPGCGPCWESVMRTELATQIS